MLPKMTDVIQWPGRFTRDEIKRRIRLNDRIPHCIGFLDGVHINLESAPALPDGGAGSYHSRKERYGLNILAVCDDKKRFTWIDFGFSASAGDSRIQRCSDLTLNAANYFDNDEFILADAAFTCCSNIIPMYKRPRGHPRLSGHLAFFNRQAAQARYRVEHAFVP